MMEPFKREHNSLVPWKLYMVTTAETLLTFYIATFCIAMYFTHRGAQSLVPGILIVMLYVFVIFACAKRVQEKLPMAGIMLIIPIAPLLALIIVISLIPVLQLFQ
jgi:hypothetical protein